MAKRPRYADEKVASLRPWGSANAPLLPKVFRTQFQKKIIPARHLVGSGLAFGVCYGELGTDIWSRLEQVTDLLRIHIRSFALRHAHTVAQHPVVENAAALLAATSTAKRSGKPDIFQRLETINRPLASLTWGDLPKISGFGVGTFFRLACSAESLDQKERPLPNNDQRFRDLRENLLFKDVPLNDQRIASADMQSLGHGSIYGAMDCLAPSRCNPETAQLLENAESRLLEVLYDTDLSRALTNLLSGMKDLNPRWKEILLLRYGWSGDPPLTLQDVGIRFDITRERVRQIQEAFEERYSARVVLPSLDSALHYLFSVAPISAAAASKALTDHGITSSPFDVGGIIEAARVWQRQPLISLNIVDDVRMVLPFGSRRLAETILAQGRRLAAGYGAVSPQMIQERLNCTWPLSTPVLQRIIHNVLAASPLFVLNGDNHTWVYTETADSRNRLRNSLVKMFCIADSLSLSSIHDGLTHAYRQHSLVNNLPSIEALPGIIATLEGFMLNGNYVRATQTFLAEEHLTEPELSVFKFFVREGGHLMTREQIIQSCAADGVPENTASCYISWSPILEQYCTGLWMLRGRPPSAIEVEITSAMYRERRATAGKVSLGYRTVDDGIIEAAYRLSKSGLRGALINLPMKIARDLPKDPYQLIGKNGEILGLANVWGVHNKITLGIRRIYRVLDFKEGDICIVRINGNSRQISARRGDEETIAEFSSALSTNHFSSTRLKVVREGDLIRVRVCLTAGLARRRSIQPITRFGPMIKGREFALLKDGAVADRGLRVSRGGHSFPMTSVIRVSGANIGDDIVMQFDLRKLTLIILNSP